METGRTASIEKRGDRVFLRGLPATPPAHCITVIELEINGEPTPGPAASEAWE